jgi:transposase InsO family protein
LKTEHPIALLCQAFDVSKSGYYQWQQRQRQPAPRRAEDERLASAISRIHQESRSTYGAPRIQAVLRQAGRKHGRNRIGRLMRQLHLCGRQKRRYRVRTTDSQHDHPIAPNRLQELPKPTAPNQIWLADITYIQSAQGWLYLAAILDLYSRKIVGWEVRQRLDTALVVGATEGEATAPGAEDGPSIPWPAPAWRGTRPAQSKVAVVRSSSHDGWIASRT